MKKLLAILTLASVLFLSGCGLFNSKEAEVGFLDDTYLAECKLLGMPTPDSEDMRHDENTVYCNLTNEECLSYASDVVAFLLAKDDIYFKGYHCDTGNPGGIFFLPEYRFAPLTSDAASTGWFAFSLTEQLNDGDEFNYSYWNGVTVSISQKEGKIGLYSYNTVIEIDNDPEFIVYQASEHEHTGEWIKNESTHYYQYNCGCPSPDIAELHSNHDDDQFCDVCGYDTSKHLTPTNYFLRNLAGCEWLHEITAEDIAEVKIISGGVGVAPGNLKNISSSTDETAIAKIFEDYYWLDTFPIFTGDGQIDGGGDVTVKFILKDGAEKALYINNGNYRDTNGDYFELLYTPVLAENSERISSYGFITYIGTGIVYNGETSVCEIPIDELEFVIIDILPEAEQRNVVETEFGKLIFYSNTMFIIEGNNDIFYQLIGKNLDDLIAEYNSLCSAYYFSSL